MGPRPRRWFEEGEWERILNLVGMMLPEENVAWARIPLALRREIEHVRGPNALPALRSRFEVVLQLMRLGWNVMLPLALANLLATAAVLMWRATP